MSVTVSPLKLSFLLIKVVKKCLSYNYPTLLAIPVAAGTGAFIEWGLHAYIFCTHGAHFLAKTELVPSGSGF